MRNDLTTFARSSRKFCLVALMAMSVGASVAAAQDRAAWMKDARWGVMTHFLADWRARVDGEPASVEHWNDLIDHFDVEGLAEQLHSVGAGYYLVTIGQNSGYYLAPNATYDKLVGITPSKCSRRDLIGDLYEPLHRRGIRLMVYLPAGAPGGDRRAAQALDYHRGADPNREFQIKWEQVIGDWSRRWGDKVSGWWFDGCYWPNAMYRNATAPNFASFAAAARAGNPNSAVAFNPGVIGRLISLTPDEDYTAGEINEPDKVLIRRVADGKVDGAVPHVLTFLGKTWGMGEPRFQSDEAVAWAGKISHAGGVLTLDVPIQKTGLISQPFLDQLQAVGHQLRSASAK
jgi:Alpha-L-fucosidase